MADSSNSGRWLPFVLLAIVIAFVVWWNQGNLVVRPLPGPAPPPMAHLPDVIGKLRSAKTLCEERVTLLAANSPRLRRRRNQSLDADRKLYAEARAGCDDLISYFTAQLTTRFQGESAEAVENRVARAQSQINDFLFHAAVQSQQAGAADPLSEFLSMLKDWLKAVREADAQAIAQLSQQLEQCRFKSWQDLAP